IESKVKSLEDDLNKLWKQEEVYGRQRAGKRWLKEGDKNTKFFHASTIQRRQRNKILRLKNGDGEWIEGEEDITNHVRGFYETFSWRRTRGGRDEINSSIPKVISDEINTYLVKQETVEEIEKAVFHLGAQKSPGPDGFPGQFFQKYWEVIKTQLCEEVKDFFESSSMPEGWNDTNVVIIPKVPNPETISQFRPISCCNFRYKIISKIMADRLKIWLPDIISEMQAAFTGGRSDPR
ncbi:LINE-1 retrotransposable element ORF2 protein, partial [Linum perenne]